ncbi:uncharacterized protein LOC130784560 isoform X3 [Actinidia eriantha]|uniref:uncharacterized protein LOC130784560 isoform X3 n=1 Tax=Actinidia eriantha TaxID=165200 RepID=UPI00258D8F01|nr:uncharacterized protein LOC130784560 isoform X3 [Actinidia eriantha]
MLSLWMPKCGCNPRLAGNDFWIWSWIRDNYGWNNHRHDPSVFDWIAFPRPNTSMVEEMTSESSNGSRLIRTLADVKYGNHHLTTVEIVYNCISFVVAIVITFAFTIHAKRTLSEHQCRIQQYSPWLRPQQL